MPCPRWPFVASTVSEPSPAVPLRRPLPSLAFSAIALVAPGPLISPWALWTSLGIPLLGPAGHLTPAGMTSATPLTTLLMKSRRLLSRRA